VTKKLGIGVLVAIAVWAVVELLFNIGFWPLVIGVLAGAAAVIVLIARARGESPRQVVRDVTRAAHEAVTEPATTTAERAAHEQLFMACQAFILEGGGTSVQPALKELAEKLRGLVPRALEFSPGSETTFNVVKLAREDLPKILYTFIRLSDADKATKSGPLATQLAEISVKLTRLGEFIDQGLRSQFDAETTFVNIKFS
jgi:hypothetical protein